VNLRLGSTVKYFACIIVCFDLLCAINYILLCAMTFYSLYDFKHMCKDIPHGYKVQCIIRLCADRYHTWHHVVSVVHVMAQHIIAAYEMRATNPKCRVKKTSSL
jgi:hypothetical protein